MEVQSIRLFVACTPTANRGVTYQQIVHSMMVLSQEITTLALRPLEQGTLKSAKMMVIQKPREVLITTLTISCWLDRPHKTAKTGFQEERRFHQKTCLTRESP